MELTDVLENRLYLYLSEYEYKLLLSDTPLCSEFRVVRKVFTMLLSMVFHMEYADLRYLERAC